jgi:hypothetical protein
MVNVKNVKKEDSNDKKKYIIDKPGTYFPKAEKDLDLEEIYKKHIIAEEK